MIKLVVQNGDLFRIPFGAGIVECERHLFIIGGSKAGIDPINSTYEYSLLKKRLIERQPLLEARTEHSAIAANGIIYCVGGRDQSKYLSSCEKCEVSLKLWKADKISEMITSKTLSTKLFCWSRIHSLNEEKASASLCHLETMIYCFGGVVEQNPISTIEKLDTKNPENEWQMVGSLKDFSNYNFSVLSLKYKGEDCFVLFGGFKTTNEASDEAFVLSHKDKIDWGKDTLHQLNPVPSLNFPEKIEFINQYPKYSISNKKLFLNGEKNIYSLDLTKEELKWETEEGKAELILYVDYFSEDQLRRSPSRDTFPVSDGQVPGESMVHNKIEEQDSSSYSRYQETTFVQKRYLSLRDDIQFYQSYNNSLLEKKYIVMVLEHYNYLQKGDTQFFPSPIILN